MDQDQTAQQVVKESSKVGPILAINSGRDRVKHSNLIIYSTKLLQQSLALLQPGVANSVLYNFYRKLKH